MTSLVDLTIVATVRCLATRNISDIRHSPAYTAYFHLYPRIIKRGNGKSSFIDELFQL